MVFDDDCSAQDECRGMKLVCLELSGHEDFECVKEKFLACLWTKRQCKTSAKDLLDLGENVAQIWPQVVGIAALQEFYKMIDSS